MSDQFAIITILEILVALLLIWGFINEKKLIKFEHRIKIIIVVNYRRYKRRQMLKRLQQLHQKSTYTPEIPKVESNSRFVA